MDNILMHRVVPSTQLVLKLSLLNAKGTGVGNINTLEDIISIDLLSNNYMTSGVRTSTCTWTFKAKSSMNNKFIVRTKYNEFTIR